MKEVLAGLNYLHSQNPPVAHGCIRIGKLFVDARGTTKIGEFGLALLFEDFGLLAPPISQAGQARWMSQELLGTEENQEYSPPTTASDVWALGRTLYEIMCGKLPYYIYKHDLRLQLEVVSKTLPGHRDHLLSPAFVDVWEWVHYCWAWIPEQRPLVEELVRLIDWPIDVGRDESSPRTQTDPSSDV
ncbi:unnamed protein product [Rhizoctonia solani]|uniref:Protein kinase domain-containing protein n=1 Tax=Rhizoctonia solani TaxID=456999 RepID=A0A8H3HDP7_9AGAM|nr:unnamed protein product [Rhizoctonia solani]